MASQALEDAMKQEQAKIDSMPPGSERPNPNPRPRPNPNPNLAGSERDKAQGMLEEHKAIRTLTLNLTLTLRQCREQI